MGQIIRIDQLSRVYRTEEVETRALYQVSLSVEAGEFVSIMGPSGCGKSTLLNILGFLDEPSSGNFFFMETSTQNFSDREKARIRKQHIGFVFQNFNLIEELTVFENVELPLIYLGMKSAERKSRVNRMLERMDMMHRASHFPAQLSGGQQQRVAVARAVITEPKLILADEPTGNLDSQQGNEVMEILSELNDQGATIIMVTHSNHDASFSRRIIRLMDGQVISENRMAHA